MEESNSQFGGDPIQRRCQGEFLRMSEKLKRKGIKASFSQEHSCSILLIN